MFLFLLSDFQRGVGLTMKIMNAHNLLERGAALYSVDIHGCSVHVTTVVDVISQTSRSGSLPRGGPPRSYSCFCLVVSLDQRLDK